MSIRSIQEMELKGKRVFIRVDFNVPLKTTEAGTEVADANRIEAALPTIKYAIEAGARVILASHLGRPDGKRNSKYSMEPVGAKLSELLKRDVLLADDCIGDGPRGLSQQLRPGGVLLLENLRFHEGEEENSADFTAKLMALCDVYISDAFGTLHRAHASTAGLPRMMKEKGMGFLVEKELSYLMPLREEPKRPLALIMGGAKISDKIGVVERFLPQVDRLFIGGAMAYAFLKAQGKKIGRSLCEDSQVSLATRILKSAAARNIQVFLPIDHIIAASPHDAGGAKTTPGAEIPDGMMGVDIGPQTIRLFAEGLDGVETIFWNGPMGVTEEPAFAKGTNDVARIVANSHAKKLAGGGDSAAAIANSGFEDKFDFISTGGGATLEFLEGKDLPGIAALRE